MKKKKIIIILILIFIISLLPLFYESISFKENKEIPKLAMYIKENDEYVKYSSSNIIPDGYRLNYTSSHCYDKDNQEQSPVRNFIKVTEEGLLLSSNISLSCELYFDPQSPIDSPNFYLKGIDEKCTKEMTNSFTLSWSKKEGEIITSYCLTEEESPDNCSWNFISENSTSIEGTYTFKNEGNGPKILFAYLKDANEIISNYSEIEIILDTTNSNCEEINKELTE